MDFMIFHDIPWIVIVGLWDCASHRNFQIFQANNLHIYIYIYTYIYIYIWKLQSVPNIFWPHFEVCFFWSTEETEVWCREASPSALRPNAWNQSWYFSPEISVQSKSTKVWVELWCNTTKGISDFNLSLPNNLCKSKRRGMSNAKLQSNWIVFVF